MASQAVVLTSRAAARQADWLLRATGSVLTLS